MDPYKQGNNRSCSVNVRKFLAFQERHCMELVTLQEQTKYVCGRIR